MVKPEAKNREDKVGREQNREDKAKKILNIPKYGRRSLSIKQ
jgi:hypothetical protein